MGTMKGTCNCGAVTLEIRGEPKVSLFCHCDDCQKAFSSASVAMLVFGAEDVELRGPTAVHTLRTQPRTFCSKCGTRVMGEPPGMGVRAVPASILPTDAFKPAFHIMCNYARYPIKDGLPHFKGFPAAFGGSDDVMEW
jgi:hypothetical protein